MELFIQISQFVLSLSILIILHELGHMLPAKYFKTKVEKFYLFFDAGFSLFKFKKGETEYGIGWIPLGGYVKIAGMIDESMDKEQMKEPAKPWEFRSKPTWQRLIIMVGGVTVLLIGAQQRHVHEDDIQTQLLMHEICDVVEIPEFGTANLYAAAVKIVAALGMPMVVDYQ